MKKHVGFTLVELLIALVIIAIISAIAFPSYNNQIRKTRRADAKAALTQAAAMQERFYMRNNSYTATLANLGATGVTLPSPEKYYNITVTNNACPNSQPDGACYTLTATATGAQASDTRCATFTLTDAGVKGATNTDCW